MSDKCPSCGESTNPSTARVVHARLGLDEAPEPVVCKCRSDSDIVNGMMRKTASVHSFVAPVTSDSNYPPPGAVLNVIKIDTMDAVPTLEVELRMSKFVSKLMYESMAASVFGPTIVESVAEVGCSWWSGPSTNSITKMRRRSNGETVAKMNVYVGELMPGIKLSVSYEFGFEGQILRPEYSSTMTEHRTEVTISGVNAKLISRKYVCEDTVSFASEIELEAGVAHVHVRAVLNEVLSTVGSENSMRNYIEPMYMSEARHSDHDVVDVGDLSPYKGTTMLKADGMKVYVFCYPNGHVTTFADPNLTVINYVIARSYMPLVEISNKPDILVAEMMADGRLFYIDTLASNGVVVPELRPYRVRPTTSLAAPTMSVRRSWSSIVTMPANVFSDMNSDGIVCVTDFRTLRLKKPTIDLTYANGLLFMNHVGSRVAVAVGHASMIEGSIYEFDVSRSQTPGEVTISNASRRLIKKVPNNSDIVRRALMSVSADIPMCTMLYDITNMSFKMRARTYEMAQTNVAATRRVIVTFGVGRFQELVKMRTSEFSYIAIDPKIDVSPLARVGRNNSPS